VTDELYSVPAVSRTVCILDAFAERPEWTVSALATQLRLPKTTVYRIVQTLVEAGVLESLQDYRVRLGTRVCAWAQSYSPAVPFVEPLIPVLERLVEVTTETANAAVIRGRDSMVVATRSGPHSVRSVTWPGRTAPLHCSAVGKALLAQQSDEFVTWYVSQGLERLTSQTVTAPHELRKTLSEVRSAGFSWERDQLEEGLWCVGAPVCRLGAETLAISVSAPAYRAARRWSQLVEHVRRASATASRALGQYIQQAQLPVPRPEDAAHRLGRPA
jgi:DNA-binding IclR family transcriptional regulator